MYPAITEIEIDGDDRILVVYQNGETHRYHIINGIVDTSRSIGGNNNLTKYKKYLNKYDLEKLLKIANNKKIKITSKLTKKQIINKLIKFKFH